VHRKKLYVCKAIYFAFPKIFDDLRVLCLLPNLIFFNTDLYIVHLNFNTQNVGPILVIFSCVPVCGLSHIERRLSLNAWKMINRFIKVQC